MAEIEKLLKSLECSVRPYKKRDNCKECKYRLLEKVDSRIPCPPDVEENGVKYWENCDCDGMVKDAIQTIRELQEDCNRYHERGMHEGYEEAKEKYKFKYWNTEHKECSQGNTIVIEEVCEWEKGSSGYVGYPAYYSKCCTTNSN